MLTANICRLLTFAESQNGDRIGMSAPAGLLRVPAEWDKRRDQIRRSEQRYRRQFASERAAAEILVLSFPKAGRTWHRLLLGHYLTQLCGVPESHALNLSELCARAKIRPVVYSHNGANFLDGLPPSSPVIACPSLWRDRHVLLLVRDPRDIVVSAYHHAAFRSRSFAGTLSAFVRDPHFGIEKILTAFNRWHGNRHLASSFTALSYEAMHADPHRVLAATLDVLGVSPIDRRLAARSVVFCAFENMQKYEKADFFDSPRLSNATGDARASKVRSGRVGAFPDHLAEDDLRWIDDCSRRLGDPFRELYSPAAPAGAA
jgi:alcohol sulfotransferase